METTNEVCKNAQQHLGVIMQSSEHFGQVCIVNTIETLSHPIASVSRCCLSGAVLPPESVGEMDRVVGGIFPI